MLGDQDGGGECKDPGLEKPIGGYVGDCDCRLSLYVSVWLCNR